MDPRVWRALVAIAGVLAGCAAVVLITRWVVDLHGVARFIRHYPGTSKLPSHAPRGLPVWIACLHFLNALLMMLIVRTGWLVRTQFKPPATWVRNNTGRLRTKNPPKRISLTLWTHLSLDALWVLTGIGFFVLLFVTGQWVRIVPTHWNIVPNAISALLQYTSLHWPSGDGWINYNSLQQLTYFVTVFVAAPLAIATGIRMSEAWPQNATRLNRVYPIEIARRAHLPVMAYFVAFAAVHVLLVLVTSPLRNLNHMYGGQDAVNWFGFGIFVASLLVMTGALLALRPTLLRPIAALMGTVAR